MGSNQKSRDRSSKEGWKRAKWNIGQMVNQRATAADHISLTTVCADKLAGQEGSFPNRLLRRADRLKGQQHGTDVSVESKHAGRLMQIVLATTTRTFMFPRTASTSLAKRGRGWEDCWPRAHLGTCCENFALAAKCPVALRLPLTFLITLKFSHMVLLPIWISAGWQLVLETHCAPRALKFQPHGVSSQ